MPSQILEIQLAARAITASPGVRNPFAVHVSRLRCFLYWEPYHLSLTCYQNTRVHLTVLFTGCTLTVVSVLIFKCFQTNISEYISLFQHLKHNTIIPDHKKDEGNE